MIRKIIIIAIAIPTLLLMSCATNDNKYGIEEGQLWYSAGFIIFEVVEVYGDSLKTRIVANESSIGIPPCYESTWDFETFINLHLMCPSEVFGPCPNDC